MVQKIRYFKGNKTLHVTETHDPEFRLVQLQQQNSFRGDNELAWTLDKDVKWEVFTGEKPKEIKVKDRIEKPVKKRTKRAKD